MTTTHDATESAHIAAILADPASDGPRLIYADWLDENAREVECERCHGDPTKVPWHGHGARCTACHGSGVVSDGRRERAEFIRVQCEIAHLDSMSYAVYNSRVEELRSRERELSDKFLPRDPDDPLFFLWDWARLLDKGMFDGHVGPAFLLHRGFVSHITCTLADWLQHGPQIVRTQPVERCVISTKRPHTIGTFSGGKWDQMFAFWPTACEPVMNTDVAVYPTEAAAMSALSDAAIAWAKAQPCA